MFLKLIPSRNERLFGIKVCSLNEARKESLCGINILLSLRLYRRISCGKQCLSLRVMMSVELRDHKSPLESQINPEPIGITVRAFKLLTTYPKAFAT